MKKKILMLMCSLLLVVTVSACGVEKQVCDFCDEEKICDTYDFLGDEILVCDDCKDELTM